MSTQAIFPESTTGYDLSKRASKIWRPFFLVAVPRSTPLLATVDAQELVAANSRRHGLVIKNNGAVVVYLYKAINDNTGFPLVAGESIVLSTLEAVYVEAASSTATLNCIEYYD